jgi:hypothetical protein
MSTYTWGYLINTFLVATEGSYRLALRMGNDHMAALNADSANPQIAPLIPIFQPLNDALAKAYGAWLAQGGDQLGDTVQVNLLYKTLSSTNAKAWDNQIQVVYADTTSDYKKLMPNHRIPFQQGPQTLRMAALNALSSNLSGILPLAATKTSVDDFISQINDAFNTQKTAIKSTGNSSIVVEQARVAVCQQIFGNYGNLLSLNQADPLSIGHYFPIKYVRTSDQVFFTHLLKPLAVHNIAKHEFAATDQLKLTTNTPASVQIYNASQKGGASTGNGVTVAGNSTLTFTADKLGDIVNNHFPIITNLDKNLEADFDLEFL